jgi:membrane protein YqaA with SNARE-associated domain
MLRRFYDSVLALAASRHAPWWLAAISFAESSFFPIPPDALLIPMCLARPQRAWRLAQVCTVASVLGGAFGYYIGYALFETAGRALIDFYGIQGRFDAFRTTFAEYGLWIILGKGLTPIPYKFVTVAAGLAHFDFTTFMAASVLTRGGRFFLVAGLLHFFGEPMRDFIERRLTLVTTIGVVGIVGGFMVLKLL